MGQEESKPEKNGSQARGGDRATSQYGMNQQQYGRQTAAQQSQAFRQSQASQQGPAYQSASTAGTSASSKSKAEAEVERLLKQQKEHYEKKLQQIATAASEAVDQKVTQQVQAVTKSLDEKLKQHIQQALNITTTSSQNAGPSSSQSSVPEKTRSPYNYTQNEMQHTKHNPSTSSYQCSVPERARSPYRFTQNEMHVKFTSQPTAQVQSPQLYPNLNDQTNANLRNANIPYHPYTGPQRMQPQASSSAFAPSAPPAPLLDQSKATGVTKPIVKEYYNKDKFRPSPNKGHCCSTCSKHFGLRNIYQCKIGHSSCQDCKDQRRLCGTCGRDIDDKRNFSLEEIIAGSQVSCPNEGDGCNYKLRMEELDEHMLECAYRGMVCPVVSRCSWRGNISQLPQHVDDSHPQYRESVDKEIRLSNILDTTHEKSYIRLDDKGFSQFLFHVKVNTDERKIFMAVQLFSTKTNANLWSYEVHVFNKREPRRKYMYADIVHSNSTPIEMIFREYKCVSIPTSYAMSFYNEGSMTFKVYIRKEFQPEKSAGGGPDGNNPVRKQHVTRGHVARGHVARGHVARGHARGHVGRSNVGRGHSRGRYNNK